MHIRIDPLDKLFSRYIRLRDKVCQRCGSVRNLQCSHYHGRRKRSVRYDEDNCCALCFGCHSYLGGNPLEHTEFFKQRLGDKFDMLNNRARISYPPPDKEAIELYLKVKIKELEEVNNE